MLTVLTEAFPHKHIHAVGDAADHGQPLLVTGTTITTRLPANAALYAPAPPRTATVDRYGPRRHRAESPSSRWSIEPANATGKQLLGVGQARNRLPRAVERTVPFRFLIQTLVIVWYTLFGYHLDDLTARHAAEPWYDQKSEPAFEDMLAKPRRALIAARFSDTTPKKLDPNVIRDYELACAAAAEYCNCETQVVTNPRISD